MEKLELKYLPHYFPYRLKCQYTDTFGEVRIGTLNLIHNDKFGIDSCIDENLKPILRPISDLTKEIEVNGKRFIPIEIIFNYKVPEFILRYNIVEMYSNKNLIPFEHVEKLFEWNFDVFGLIEKGLAIDINTLTK